MASQGTFTAETAISLTEAAAGGSRSVNTICSFCGVGCGLTVSLENGRIDKVRGDGSNPYSRGRTCVKGINGWHYVFRDDRLTEPMVRKNGRLVAVSWEEALDRAAAGLGRVKDEYGPHAFAMMTSSKATNELNYAAQKFARLVMGTNNVDSCNRS